MVALRASSGEFVWGYQTVHHDLWDYDLASQPLLFEHMSALGTRRPAVAQATKTGFVFVLDRESGDPLHSVVEREVPASDVAGEVASRTQPFPKLQLHETDARPLTYWDYTYEHRKACQRLMTGVRYEGPFTPPSLDGTLLYPGNPGGVNWGSMAYNSGARVGYLAVARLSTVVKLIAREQYRSAVRAGTPYGMARFELINDGLPCLDGPWATLVAMDLDKGEILWERPVGRFRHGGPMVTAGGVVFLASSASLRAFDGTSGDELWSSPLPASAHATPMGYRQDGIDYVVITAGGRRTAGEGQGDYVIAFRLSKDSP